MTPLTFIRPGGGTPFRKHVQNGQAQHPVLPAVWDSETIHVLPTELPAVRDELIARGEDGWALLKGQLSQELLEQPYEPFLKHALVDWLYLDLDDLPVDEHVQWPIQPAALADLAKRKLREVYPKFADVQSLVWGSARCGLSPKALHLHVWIPLDPPVPYTLVTLFLRNLWLDSVVLQDHTRLAPGGGFCLNPLDLYANDPLRPILIAPPTFGDDDVDPFKTGSDRFAIVDGHPAFNLRLEASHVDSSHVRQRTVQIVNRLRRSAGKVVPGPYLRTQHVHGRTLPCLIRGDYTLMHVADNQEERHVYLELDEDTTQGWYIERTDPRYVRNLKGHPILYTTSIAPDFMQHLQALRSLTPTNTRPKVCRDIHSGRYMAFLHDGIQQTWDRDYGVQNIARRSVRDFLNTHQEYAKRLDISEAKVEFDPSKPPRAVNPHQALWHVNTYAEPDIRRNLVPCAEVASFDEFDVVPERIPTIWTIIRHALGDEESARVFVNWLAYIWQRGDKTETAWVISGVDGTGKGLIVHQICPGLFGTENVAYRRVPDLYQADNEYIARSQIIALDEFHYRTLPKQLHTSIDEIRGLITEPTMNVRSAHLPSYRARTYCNFIFLTNYDDALHLTATDRRFNVSVRQEVPIRDAHPEIFDQLEVSITQELPMFAGILEAWTLDELQARSVMQNGARLHLISPGTAALDDCAKAIRDADLAYFAALLMRRPRHPTEMELQAQRLVAGFVWDAHAGFPTIATQVEIYTVFHALTGRTPHIPRYTFNQHMANRRLARRAYQNPRDGKQRKGFRLRWPNQAMATEIYNTNKVLIDRYYQQLHTQETA